MEYAFVYGTLKYGYPNNFLLREADLIGEAITKSKNFIMWCEEYFPYVKYSKSSINLKTRRNNITLKPGHILGELYQIDKKILKSLDILEGHPDFYKRAKVDITLLDYYSNPIKSWIYLIPNNPEYIRPGSYYKNNIWIWKGKRL